MSFCFPAADNARAGGMEGVVEGWRAWLTCCERAGLQHLETALALDPHSKVAQKNLGDALARKQVCAAASPPQPSTLNHQPALPSCRAQTHARTRTRARQQDGESSKISNHADCQRRRRRRRRGRPPPLGLGHTLTIRMI